jgi:hypothetical protein
MEILMAGKLDHYFRALTSPLKPQPDYRADRRISQPEHALIFPCFTTTTATQELVFGAYICAQLKNGNYVAKEIGLFYCDDHPEEFRVLNRFVKGSTFELGTVNEFRRKVFLKYLKAGELMVAYDAPFEISRIALKWNKSLKRRRCSTVGLAAFVGISRTSFRYTLSYSAWKRKLADSFAFACNAVCNF